MSSRSRRVVVSTRARDDLRDILFFGHRTWGPDQADAYEAALDRALRRIAEFPYLGRQRDEWFPGCRGFAVGQHVILYSVEDEEIVVVRIIHARHDSSGQVRR